MKTRIASLLTILLLMSSAVAAQTPTRSRPAPINVRLTFYLIQANGYTNEDPEIRPIVVELRKIFKFQGYRLASKSIVNVAADPNGGQTSARHTIMDPDGVPYQIEAFVGAQDDRTTALLYVHLYRDPVTALSGNIKNPAIIDASINLRDGKTVVLGSATGGKDKAIILAVTPAIEK